MTPPIIRLGSQPFYDITGMVGRNRYARVATRAIAIHHTVGAQFFPNQAAELQHIIMIDAQHRANGWGGFGYQAIAFESGAVYVVGDTLGARAHVANQNPYYVGIAMAGDYSTRRPPIGIVLGAGRFILAQLEMHGLIPATPHRLIPGQSTFCCGDGGAAAIDDMLRVAVALKVAQRGQL